MHELSVAQSIVDFALSEADNHQAKKVKELQVGIGELMRVDMEVLVSALASVIKASKLEGCKVEAKQLPASFSCRRCYLVWGMQEADKQLGAVQKDLLVKEPDSDELPLHFMPCLYPAFIHCPSCGSSDISVVEGEDVKIMRMVLE